MHCTFRQITTTWGFNFLFCKMGTNMLALSVSWLFVKMSYPAGHFGPFYLKGQKIIQGLDHTLEGK